MKNTPPNNKKYFTYRSKVATLKKKLVRTVPKPTSMGGGGGAGAKRTALPGMEQIKTKSEVKSERLGSAQGRVNNFRQNLDNANAKVRELKNSNASKSELAKAINNAAKIRQQWKQAKISLNTVQRGRMSWNGKNYGS